MKTYNPTDEINQKSSQNFTRLDRIFDWFQSSTVSKIVWVVAGLLLAVSAFLIYRTIHGDPYWRNSTDFAAYLKAANFVKHGQNPYDINNWTPAFFYGTDTVRDQYSYPPLFAEFILVLSLPSDDFAHGLWLFINIALFSGTALLLLRGFGIKVPYQWVALVVGLVGISYIVRDDLYHGQANFLLLFLFTASLYFLSKNKEIPAGLLLGLMFVIKPFLGIFVLYLLWKRAWKATGVSLVTGGVLMVISFLPLLLSTGFASIQSWLQVSSYYSSGPMATRPDNYSLHGLFLRLFSNTLFVQPWLESQAILLLCEIALIALLAIILIRTISVAKLTNNQKPYLILFEAGLYMALIMSYGPLTEGDHLMILLPSLVGVLFMAYQNQTRHWLALAVVWVLVFLLYFSPISLTPGLPSPLNWHKISGPIILETSNWGILFLLSGLFAAWVYKNSNASKKKN